MDTTVMNTSLCPGTVLHNNFRVERVIGQGGFGITYLGWDMTLERTVAIKEFFPREYCNRGQGEDTKVMTVGTDGNKALIERLKTKFLKEARNIAKFDCAYIIKIFTAFEENGTAYYVMEYIDGENLRDMVRRDGALSVDRATYYIQKIGKALEYVHGHHINHLDVKPANIMVRRSDNRPILIDFGLSKQYDGEGYQTSTTPTGLSHGFAPAEQYKEGGVSDFAPQTDLYSLAATLYFVLTGVVPPQAVELISHPLVFPAGFPKNLEDPIRKAMSLSPAQRHETVAAFVAEITSGEVKEDEKAVVPQFEKKDKTAEPEPDATYMPDAKKKKYSKKSKKSKDVADFRPVNELKETRKRRLQRRFGVSLMIFGLIVALFVPVSWQRVDLEDVFTPDDVGVFRTMKDHMGKADVKEDSTYPYCGWEITFNTMDAVATKDGVKLELEYKFNKVTEDGDYSYKKYEHGDFKCSFYENEFYFFGNLRFGIEKDARIFYSICLGFCGAIFFIWGVILRRKGKLALLSQYAQYIDRNRHGGKAIFENNGKFGVINVRKAKVVMPAEYDSIRWDKVTGRFRTEKA